MDLLQQHIESLIFVAAQPIKIAEMRRCIQDAYETSVRVADIEAAIEALRQRYNESDSAVEIVEINGGYQFMTKGAFHQTVGQFLKWQNRKKLTRAALETLAIIAYKQPVTKSELESIRGVNSDYTVQKLLEKELVEISGRGDGPGRPLIYVTSAKFMDHFGLSDVSDLPKPKDFALPEQTIGEPAPIEEDGVFSQSSASEEE